MNTKCLAIFIGAVLMAQQSSAGETLHLESGDVQIQNLKANDSLIKVKTSTNSNSPFKARDTHNNIISNFNVSLSFLTETPSQYFIVQFTNAITPQDEQALTQAGLEILRYVPDDAYIVRGNESQLEQTKKSTANFKEFSFYQPQLRMSSELKLRSVFNRDNLQTVKLQLFKGVDAESVADQLQEKGVLVLSVSESVIEARATVKILDQVAATEGVEWVSKKAQMKLRNFVLPKENSGDTNSFLVPDGTTSAPADIRNLTGYETGTKVMGFDKAWGAGFKGSGQIIGIADSGLDTGEKSTLAKDFSHLKDSYALGLSSKSWADYVGHGTHVAGSVGGSGEQTGKLVLGGAYEAQLVAQSLWSQKYENLTTPDSLGVIFNQAYKTGARIHTNSWGNPEAQGLYDTESMQVDQFVWDNPEMLILFASGNDGVDADKDGRIDPGAVSSPSTAKNIISVGASENLVKSGGVQRKLGEISLGPGEKPWSAEPIASDTLSNNPRGIVAFSSRGPTKDGRLKPDLVAPGSNILSNCSKMKGAEELWGRFNENYCWSGGTSMATPLVAGAAAIVRERLMRIPDMSTPSAAIVKAVLLHTAEDLYPGQFGEVGKAAGQELLAPGPNFEQGYGRVDVGRAISAKLNLVDNKTGLATGETKSYDATGAFKKVTLVYNDAPASLTAASALVNNLDLEVQVGGKIYKSESIKDNTEQVVLPSPGNGTMKILVHGKNVPMGKNGKQPYALVFSN